MVKFCLAKTHPYQNAPNQLLLLGCVRICPYVRKAKAKFPIVACRWPGGVHSAPQLWEMLKEKRSGFSEFKKDRINVDGFYHPAQNRPGSFHMRGGHFLDEDPKLFDNDLFRINAVEARSMDPAQRKLLEVTFEAFENAGEPWDKFAGSKTGVFVGNFMSDHQNMQFRDPDNPMPYVTTGGDIAIHSNRINYVFNLKGPRCAVFYF